MTGDDRSDDTIEEAPSLATVTQIIRRVAWSGNRDAAGPLEPPTSIEIAHPTSSRWSDGWWQGATRKPAHPGRVGGPILPWATVVHTTDMLPEEWAALVHAWTDRPADGSCAHFLIGRTEQDGVVQFVPIMRNANHAGGPGHGVFDTKAARGIHPNLVTVGIELHCAGGVRQIGGEWRLVESGVAHGKPIPDADVVLDPQRPGRGWHRVTDYQLAQLGDLLAELELVLQPMPPGANERSTGEAVPSWALPRSPRVVGHCSLDPTHRSDPWPTVMAWLRARS